jgi:hypothetical protein
LVFFFLSSSRSFFFLLQIWRWGLGPDLLHGVEPEKESRLMRKGTASVEEELEEKGGQIGVCGHP